MLTIMARLHGMADSIGMALLANYALTWTNVMRSLVWRILAVTVLTVLCLSVLLGPMT